jgi:YVTN family beta-propeller protein
MKTANLSGNAIRVMRGAVVCLLAVLLFPSAAWSQGLVQAWSHGFGDAGLQYGYSVDVDGAGNSVATGYFQGTVDFGGGPLTSEGGNDIFVVKFDAAGNHIWSRSDGGFGHQEAYRVALDAAGNAFVTGTFADTLVIGEDVLVSAGANDIFVAKFDSTGVPVWSRKFGDLNEQVGYGLDTDGFGNVLVTGYFNGTVDFGGGPLTGDYDVFVVKFDTAGNHVWSQRFGDDSDQFGQGLGVDGAGNVLVTGYFYGDLDFGGGPLTSAGDVDIFVAKLDPAGNHIWSQRFGDATDQYGYNVAADGSGNVLVSGYYWGDVDFGGGTLTSAGDYDIFVAKFDSAGTHLWSKRFGDAAQQAGYGLAVDGSGNVLLSGYLFGTVDFGGGTLTAPGGNNDIFVAKFDPAGTHVWSQNFGDADPQFGYGIAAEPGGHVVVTGGFQGEVNFGGSPITSGGNYDVFVAKFSVEDEVPPAPLPHAWSQAFGGAGATEEVGWSVDSDADGNVFVTGQFQGAVSFGGATLTATGLSDVFVAKYGPSGNHIWSKQFGGAGEEYGISLAVDGAGNVLVTGFFDGTIDFGGGTLSSDFTDIFVAKLDPSGNHIWSNRFGDDDNGGNNQFGIGIATNALGHAFITGTFEGVVNLGGASLVSAGPRDMYVAAYNAFGAHMWSRQFGDIREETGQDIAVNALGEVVVTGFRQDGGDNDILVVKYNAVGLEMWNRVFGDAPANQFGYGVALDGLDNVLLTGYFESTVFFGGSLLTSSGGYDIFVAKLDPFGTHMWSQRFGDYLGDQFGASIAADGANNVLLSGFFNDTVDFGGALLTSAGEEDICIARFNASGSHLWSERFGGPGPQYGYSVATDASDNALLTGGFEGTVNFGGSLLTSGGGRDVFVAKFSAAQLPNLDVVSFSGPPTAEQAENIAASIDLTIGNSGGADVTTNFDIGVYHSTDSVINTSDTFVVGWVLPGLVAGEDTVLTAMSAVLPLTTPTGAGYLGVIVDGFDQVAESAEGDNTASSPIVVNPFEPETLSHAWSRRFGGSTGDDGAWNVTADASGNVIVTGVFVDSVDLGGGLLPGMGEDDVFLAKYDATGNHLWSRAYGDVGTQIGWSVSTDIAGNVFLAGQFEGTVSFGGAPLTSAGGFDIFIAKFGPGGNHLWSHSFGDAGDQHGYSVSADNGGNVVLTGEFQGAVNFGGGGLTSAGGYDIFVAKFGPGGNHVWSQSFGDVSGFQSGYSVAVDAANDILVTGPFDGSVNFGGAPLTSVGGSDVFVAKFGSGGNHIWSKSFGDASGQYGYYVAADGGLVLLTGYYAGTVNFGSGPLTSAGGDDIFVAKFDASGNPLWSRSFGDAGNSYGYSVAPDASGNVFLTGYFDGSVDFGGGSLVSAGGTDVYVAKLDASGAHVLSYRFGDAASAWGYSVAVDPGDNTIVSGAFQGSIDFGGGALVSAGGTDVYLAKFGGALPTPAGEVVVYFDPALTLRQANCPGVVQDTLWVAAENLGTSISSIEYRIVLPSIMTFVSDGIVAGSTATGTSVSGIHLDFNPPLDATGQAVLQPVVVQWTCDDCVQFNDPLAVGAHPASGAITSIAYPSGNTIVSAGGTSQICVDSDGDGVLNGIDTCPTESASNYDVDGDGCVDFAADNRRVEFWTIPDFPVPYVINQNGAPGIPVGDAVSDVQNALTTWNDAGSRAAFSFGGLTPQLDAQAMDQVNLVTFHDPDFAFPPGVLAVGIATSFTTPTFFGGQLYRPGQLFDFDMIFNDAVQFNTSAPGSPQILDVAVHEGGHGLGISHSVVQTSAMAYVLTPSAETLKTDDVISVQMQYQPTEFDVLYGQLGGTIRDGYTDNPIAGAVVFAVDAATEDTVGCAITRDDGGYIFMGLASGDYFVAVQPLDGSSAINYIQPGNINPVVAAIPPVLFSPEWWDADENNLEDPPNNRNSILLYAGYPRLDIDIVTNVDLTAPTVTSVSPADNTLDVPIGSAVLIQFSERINTGTIQGNLKLMDTSSSAFLSGSAAVLSDETLIAFIPSGITFSTTYELTVEPGLTDQFGNSIAAPFVSHFTTEAQPPVFITSLSPGQGPVGTIVTIEGGGFESETGNNVVTFDGVPAVVRTATALQLTVTVPPGATSGQVHVLNSIFEEVSNDLPFTVLTPQLVVKGSDAGLAAVGALPRALTLLPDASQAFIATTDGFAVVETDATQSSFLDAAEVLVPGGLDGIDATAVGDRVYAVSTTNAKFYGIDTSPVAVTNEVAVPSGTPLSVLVDSGRRRAYVPTDLGQITIWDIHAENVATYETQIGFIDVGPNLRGPLAIAQGEYLLALSGTGKLLVFDLGPDTLLSEVSVGLDPRGVVTNPQGDVAYVTDAGGSVDVVSLTSFTNLQTIETGGSLRQPAVTPDGAFLFAVNRELNVFSVIDLRVSSPTFHQVVANPALGVNPTAGEIGSDGLFAFATSEMDQTLNAIAIGLGSTLNTVSPLAAPIGARLVLAGSGFADDDTTRVSFNGTLIYPEVLEADRIVVTVPSNATSGPLSVVGTNVVGPPAVSNTHFFAVLDTTPPGSLRLAGGAAPSGAPGLNSVLAASPAGDFVVVGGQVGDIHFLDSDPQSPTLNQFFDQASVSPLVGTDDIVVTPDGKRTFVLEDGAAQISVVNSDRFSPNFKDALGPVDLSGIPGADATKLAMSPDGRTLLVSDQTNESVHVVDIEEGSPTLYDVITTLNFAGAAGTNGQVREMAFHPAGRYAYLGVIDAAVANLVLVLDTTSGTIVGNATFPGVAPFEIPQSMSFTPDGNVCLVLTTQIQGIRHRTLFAFDTSDPVNPALLGSYPIASTAPLASENVRVSPAGDRAVVNIRQEGYYYFDIEDPVNLALLQIGGNVLHHLATLDFDWCRDPSITTDRTCFYSIGFGDTVYVQDFSAPRDLAGFSGDGQNGVAGQTLPAQIKVRARYLGSVEPAAGVPVTFTVTGGGGVLTGTGTSTEVAVTGADGIAGVGWTLGPGVGGGHQVEAVAFGLGGSPVLFNADAVADPNTLPLAVSDVTPPNTSANVNINTSTQITFSRAVDTSSVGSTTMRILQGSTVVPVTYGFADMDRRVSMTPTSPLAASTTYTIELTTGILDAASGPLSTPLSTTFTTQAPPPLALNSVSPTSALPGTPIIISGAGLDPDETDNVVTFSPGVTATVTDAGADFVTVDVPIGATSGPIAVEVNSVTATIAFTVLMPQEEAVDEVIANIGTGTPTRSIGITPDGTRAYATGENVVVTIDVENLTSGDAIPVGQNPVAIVISPDGDFAYVANNGSGTVSIIDVNPMSIDFETTVDDVNVGALPVDLAIHPDGDRVFVVNSGSNNISIIDTDEFSETFHAVIGNVGTGSTSSPRTVTITPDGTKLYIGTDQNIQILSALDYGVIGNMGTSNTGIKSVTVTPDGTKLVALTVDGQIVVYDIVENSPTENQVIGSFGGSSQQTKSVTVTPDGTQLWAVQEVGDVILVLSLDFTGGISVVTVPSTARTLEIVAEVDAGEDPAFVVFDPRGTGTVLVANPGDRTITVLSRRSLLSADVEITPNEFKVWKIRSDDPTGIHLKSTMRFVSARIEVALPAGEIAFGESDVEEIELKDSPVENGNGHSAPAVPGETEVRDDDGDGVREIYVKFDRLDFQREVPPGESVAVLVKGKIRGVEFMGLDTVQVLAPRIVGPAAAQAVAAGAPFEVTWQSPAGAAADEVDVYWTHGDASDWYAIANRVTDTGSVTWVTPEGHFAECRVMIVLSRNGQTIGSAMSQEAFTIGSPARVAMAGVEVIQGSRGARLQWTTSFESGIDGFNVLRSQDLESGYERVTDIPVPARGEKSSYAFDDDKVRPNRTYYYKLQEVSKDVNGQMFGPYTFVSVARFVLEQNAPNPFNPTTVIRFTLPEDSHVRLAIYDVGGRLVRTLVDDKRMADFYEITWDGRDGSGNSVASGVYFYRIDAGEHRATKKMVMLK